MAWLSSASHKPPDDDHHSHSLSRDMFNGLLKAPSRPHTPLSTKLRNSNAHHAALSQSAGPPAEAEPNLDEDPQVQKFKSLYEETESRIADLFDRTGQVVLPERPVAVAVADEVVPDQNAPAPQHLAPTSKKRKLDDDYDDYDDDEDEDEEEHVDRSASPLKNKTSKVQIIANGSASPIPRPVHPSRPTSDTSKTSAAKEKEKPEDARKKLEETKRREQETVLNMSRTLFFTLENDRDAMLDQQRLEEAERRAEAEAEGHAKGQSAVAVQQGSLSTTNLGASSLTLKNLIARIDQRRGAVHASDTELRALMSEVRKNRSKWASEDKVGQEELYEAAEKVLNELKAQTEHSSPFLQPVKKKDAPDYFQVIKLPMDLGTMTKKLKQLAYKSKQEFVDDVHLVWTNCLKYNSASEHPMRKHALCMRKETDKLVPLIPDVVIRDRAEVEAEERRQRIANGEFEDNAEESDDEPIMASRGRKAPSKKASKAPNASRKATVGESTPNPETKPNVSQMTNGGPTESEADGSQGHSTPPPGLFTPSALDRGASSVIDGGSEMPDSEIPGMTLPTTPPEIEDEEYRLWKQKTKKERAQLAAARHKLFRGDKLNADEEALLRNKSRMRRWMHMQPEHSGSLSLLDAENSKPQPTGTFAEGLEPEEESLLPDYYDSLSAVPDIDPRLRWEQDNEGNVIDQDERYLRLYPQGRFVAPEGKLSQRMANNLHQIQETRKVVSKIGVVKQMQLQSQIYQNQFAKFEPAPFLEQDIKDHVMNDDGPVMAPWVAKAALTRSIGQIFFHAGFEEFQPSAMDAIADITSDFFKRIVSNLSNYLTEEKISVPVVQSEPNVASNSSTIKSAVSREEAVLHTLHESGLSVNDLDYYATEEMERTSTRLATMFERMRAHYAELLRPAMTDDTAQGQGAFDTGEQFVGGDFADDLGEDFFGFKELGLDKEFGLVNMTVPLHLLHNRLAATNQQSSVGTESNEKLFKTPQAYPRVNVENVENEIGLVREFFKKKLKENSDRPLPEDIDLPLKQRKGYGRARVPATGKIGDGKTGVGFTSPQKKPPPSANRTASSTTVPKAGTKKKTDTSASQENASTNLTNGVANTNGSVTPNPATENLSNGLNGASLPSPQTNGTPPNESSPEKEAVKKKGGSTTTPSKPPAKAKGAAASVKKEKLLTNGSNANGNGAVEGGDDDDDAEGEEEGMISPESL